MNCRIRSTCLHPGCIGHPNTGCMTKYNNIMCIRHHNTGCKRKHHIYFHETEDDNPFRSYGTESSAVPNNNGLNCGSCDTGAGSTKNGVTTNESIHSPVLRLANVTTKHVDTKNDVIMKQSVATKHDVKTKHGVKTKHVVTAEHSAAAKHIDPFLEERLAKHIDPFLEERLAGHIDTKKQLLHTSTNSSLISLGILPVRISWKGGDRSIEGYALLDSGSTATVFSESLVDLLGATGTPAIFDYDTVNNTAREECVTLDLRIESLDGEGYVNCTGYSQHDLKVNQRTIPTREQLQEYPHLSEVGLQNLPDKKVLVLVGMDVPEAHCPLKVARGKNGDPFAIRSLLGWAVYGQLERVHQRNISPRKFDKPIVENKSLKDAEPACSRPCHSSENKTSLCFPHADVSRAPLSAHRDQTTLNEFMNEIKSHPKGLTKAVKEKDSSSTNVVHGYESRPKNFIRTATPFMREFESRPEGLIKISTSTSNERFNCSRINRDAKTIASMGRKQSARLKSNLQNAYRRNIFAIS